MSRPRLCHVRPFAGNLRTAGMPGLYTCSNAYFDPEGPAVPMLPNQMFNAVFKQPAYI